MRRRPAFKATWDDYSAATRRLGALLINLFAQALGADTDYFAEAFRHDVTLYSANWYPSQPAGLGPDDLLLEQHADSGAVTVLHQRGSYDGLQIMDRDGQWVTVPIHPEAFVINIGWLMNRWTNGNWPATMHRVVPGPRSSDSRSSVAMHFLPNIDEVIAPLPELVGEEGPRHAPITTYAWQREFMADYVMARHDWAPVKELA
jgi:isopenicillin N synthase-like dioxygenase